MDIYIGIILLVVIRVCRNVYKAGVGEKGDR